MKLYNIHYSFYWFILFLGLSFNASAQTYSGASGGGYASSTIGAGTFIMPNDSLLVNVFDATVFPNPLGANEEFKARFSGVKNGELISVVVSNLIGSKLLVDKIKVTDEAVIDLPYDKLSKGIYLITFQYKTNRITRRFNYIN